jgi:hypothetical protein
MVVGERSAPWVELTEGSLDDSDRSQRQRADDARGASPSGISDWGLMLGFTAIMTIPFALVAWLMS